MMKKGTVSIICVLLIAGLIGSIYAAGPKKGKNRTIILKNGRIISVPRTTFDFDFSEFEDEMREAQKEMAEAQREVAEAQRELAEVQIDIPEISVKIPEIDIPDINVHVPHFRMDLHDIPDIPEINVKIPEIKIDGYTFTQNLDRDERERLDKYRELARKSNDKAVAQLGDALKKESHPALRYKLVLYLGKFADDSDAAIDILTDVMRNDDSLRIRKKAGDILADSDNPRAKRIMERLSID